jgi:hypothetical protein
MRGAWVRATRAWVRTLRASRDSKKMKKIGFYLSGRQKFGIWLMKIFKILTKKIF